MAVSKSLALLAATPSSKAIFSAAIFGSAPGGTGDSLMVHFRRVADADAHIGEAGTELVGGGGDPVAARLQAQLHELPALVALGGELAAAAFHELDAHDGIGDRLAVGADHLAFDESRLRGGGHGEGQDDGDGEEAAEGAMNHGARDSWGPV